MHRAATLSSITSNTDDACAPPNLSVPSSRTQPTPSAPVCTASTRKTRQWINESAAGPKGNAERMEDKEKKTQRQEDGNMIRQATLDWMVHKSIT